ICDQSRICAKGSPVQLGFAEAALVLLLGQKMIFVRERMNLFFGLWLGMSRLVVFGLVWAYCGWRTCSGGESVEFLAAVFTNAQEILDLGIDKARGISAPVVITGVLTFPVPDRSWAFVQDSTAGILVAYTNGDVHPVPGERVKVTGHVGAGLLAPIIRRG